MVSRLMEKRETWITGIGIVSSLGEGLEATWDALQQRRVNVDQSTYAPWMVHPLAPVNFDLQIPKRGDQRQMEAWQRIGTYAAGLALNSAGIKDDKEILARRQHIHCPRRVRFVADVHGGGSRRRGRRPDCMGKNRCWTERGCAGRCRTQRRAQGNADALRMRRIQPEERLRIGLVAQRRRFCTGVRWRVLGA